MMSFSLIFNVILNCWSFAASGESIVNAERSVPSNEGGSSGSLNVILPFLMVSEKVAVASLRFLTLRTSKNKSVPAG